MHYLPYENVPSFCFIFFVVSRDINLVHERKKTDAISRKCLEQRLVGLTQKLTSLEATDSLDGGLEYRKDKVPPLKGDSRQPYAVSLNKIIIPDWEQIN